MIISKISVSGTGEAQKREGKMRVTGVLLWKNLPWEHYFNSNFSLLKCIIDHV